MLKIKSKTKIGRGRFEINAWALSDLFWANGLVLSLICLKVSSQKLQQWLPNIKTQASSLVLLFYSAHSRNPKPKTVWFFFSLKGGPSTKQKALALYLLGSTCELSLQIAFQSLRKARVLDFYLFIFF